MQHTLISKRLITVVILVIILGLGFYIFSRSQPNIVDRNDGEVAATSTLANPVATTSTSTNITLDDCSQEVPIELIDDVAIDLDRTATLRWFDGGTQQNVSRKFKFDPKTDFAGCSESVKRKLRELDEVTKEAYGDEYNKLFIE